MANREELAWAAGFFDGEGSTSLSKYRSQPTSPGLAVSIGQIGREALDRFQRAVEGLGRVYEIRTVPGTYMFRTSKFEHGQAIIGLLWLFLCSVKRDQAARVLQAYHQAPRQLIQQRKRDWHGRLMKSEGV